MRPFDYDGLHYQPVVWRGDAGVVETDNGVRATSLERTVVDSIADFTRICGLEELLRCLALIPSLDEKRLLEALEMYGQGQLYQKAGYILEAYKGELSLSEIFFSECMVNSSINKTYLFSKQDAGFWNWDEITAGITNAAGGNENRTEANQQRTA